VLVPARMVDAFELLIHGVYARLNSLHLHMPTHDVQCLGVDMGGLGTTWAVLHAVVGGACMHAHRGTQCLGRLSAVAVQYWDAWGPRRDVGGCGNLYRLLQVGLHVVVSVRRRVTAALRVDSLEAGD
jgi:hypothetical protein